MRRASLVSASSMRTTSRKNPTLLSRVRSSRDNGFPRSASAMRNMSCPPSRIGMGSRFRIARLIEKNATKVSSQSRPNRATCPEIWPTVMMPPPSRNEVSRSTRPFRNPSTTWARPHVSWKPETRARPRGSRTWIVGGLGAAPMAPYTRGRGDALSVSTLLSGTTVTGTICSSRSTSNRTGLPGLLHTARSTALQDRSVSPLARTSRSPGRKPARIAGRPGETEVDEERNHRVHRDTREDHDRPLPHGLAVERARRVHRDVGLPTLDTSGHALVLEPRHLHVATERQPREPVLCLPAPPAENGTPKADREPQDLDPHGLRGEEVAQLVHEDQ